MIIGLSGKMQVGKTTVASYLADLCGGRRASFADALRQEVVDEFGVPMPMLTDAKFKSTSKIPRGFQFVTPRELLQWWGAQRREADPLYWVKRLMETISPDELVIVDDVRYRNEAETIRQAGGVLIRIEPYPEYPINPGAYHRSETDLDDWRDWDYWAFPPYGGLRELARYLKERVGL